jgi:hypothetical protein
MLILDIGDVEPPFQCETNINTRPDTDPLSQLELELIPLGMEEM